MVKERRGVRVLIIAEHASARYGGEAILPLHIFRGLRRRGVDARMIVHGRTRDELKVLLPEDIDRIHLIPDDLSQRLLFRLGKYLPHRIGYFSTGLVSRLVTQWRARRIAKRLVAEHSVDLVHQPIPVSPREPSLIYNLGVPVVMGPLNGGMTYPEAFRSRQSHLVSIFFRLAHHAPYLMHWLMPGKLLADTILVANERTRDSLPSGLRGEVLTMFENGVDLSLWTPAGDEPVKDGPVRIVFVGRLIDCKAVDLLLEAFRDVIARTPATLHLAGDGPMRLRWESKAKELGLDGAVRFLGWLSQEGCAELLRRSDVMVLPSLHECGGAVVLEAMAVGIPVIAANWGGPADYLDSSCGILVDPTSRASFVEGLAKAMLRLAGTPDLQREMGRAGRERVLRDFDWDRKIEGLLNLYERMIQTCPEPEASSWRGADPILSEIS
jgi:glycosyltransferase involved in cell wall biosynthesis